MYISQFACCRQYHLPRREVIPKEQWKIYPGDTVQVMKSWPKDFNKKDTPDTHFHRKLFKEQPTPASSASYVGKQGVVKEIFPPANTIIIDGINMGPHFEEPSLDYPPGRVLQKPRSIPYHNVLLVDPATQKPDEVDLIKVRDRDNKMVLVRRFRTSEQDLRIPPPRVPWANQKEGPMDTKPSDVAAVTYTPTLLEPPYPNSLANELYRMKRKRKESHAI
ncbi:hypothetical protein SeLEV6574_g01245 [Synchytrium endobioticum]|uniref:KOW domain-containing protein n=1 Tax=Synchytrium endobioticum TaxID=286115 RepID=A0A507DGA3_9FUNG|nr:hypothetical protein SeLEV6574_g01245 [Synchytrium endobioticum]